MARITNRKQGTEGEWTRIVGYDPQKQEMTIQFSDGFVAIYPNISQALYNSALHGSTTQDGRHGSVGAWLHRHPGIMHHYRRG